VDEVLARCSKITVACAALDAAINEFPGRTITLYKAGRLIDGTARRQRENRRV
jgi:hypothetical protein